ncbi:hypothetical protein, partial [Burkholderia pseudomallei]|uniref:hypothetical protein n=1 Tax=Burkholderia pseudomallei TaxID=28450 RepID=UPI00201A866E
MAPKRFGTAFIATATEGAELVFRKLNRGNWELRYKPAPKAINLAKQWNEEFIEPKESLLLAKGDTGDGVITTYPLNTNAASPSFLLPKYNQLRAIEFVGFSSNYGWFIFDDAEDTDVLDAEDIDSNNESDDAGENDEDSDFSWPRSLDDIKEFFRELPSGFVRDPYFGLGLNYDLRFITDAVETIDGLKTLTIVKGRNEPPSHADSTYSLSAKLFDEVRKTINRTHDAAVNFANSEKMAYANNSLLHPIDGAKYPLSNAKYQRDSIDLPPTNRASRSLVKFVFGEKDEHEEALYGTANHRVSEGSRGR